MNSSNRLLSAMMVIALIPLIAQSTGHAAPGPDTGVRFTDTSNLLGNLRPTRTYAVSWADYDGDGRVDVFLNNHVSKPTLLHNNGRSFVDRTDTAGVGIRSDHHSCHWADYDNDDDLDLFCTTGAKRGTGSVPAHFWQNKGNGTFSEIAGSTGTTHSTARGRSLSWLDIDQDGDLDLFVGTKVQMRSNPVSLLYRQDDGDRFPDIARQAGLDLPGTVLFSTVIDYEEDGDEDLLWWYLGFDKANSPCSECILVMRNNGRGQFTPVKGNVTGIDTPSRLGTIGTMSVGDYDNDGDLDLLVAGAGANNKHLYRNGGNGTFSDVSFAAAGLSAMLGEPVEQAIWADFDNDGSLDLFFVVSDKGKDRPNRLFFGTGNGTFRDGTTQAQVQGTKAGPADVAAAADFNNDGFLDILTGNGAGEVPGPYQLFRNGGNSNHWLRVRVKGTADATALGSKIWISVNGNVQYREYSDQNDGHAFHEPVVHFGAGAARSIDWLRVQWPDGSTRQLNNLRVDQLLTLSPGGSSANGVPSVSINAPADSSTFPEGNRVHFAATATDPEDGNLSGSLSWNSSREGMIGSGGSFSVDTLSEGTHVITASVEDRAGAPGSDSISLAIGDSGGGTTLALTDTADTFSRRFEPNATSGNATFIRVNGPNEHKVGFIRFDVSGLGNTASRAILKLYVQDVPDSGVLDVHAVQGAWNETELTHDNKPPYNATPIASVALTHADEGTVVGLDVTNLVQQWAAAPNAAFGIALSSEALHALFDSRENGQPPLIEIEPN